jgi:hypothetical protein
MRGTEINTSTGRCTMWTLSRDLGFWQLLRDDELPAADGFETWGLNGDYAVGCAAGGDNGGLIACRPAQFGGGNFNNAGCPKTIGYRGSKLPPNHFVSIFVPKTQSVVRWELCDSSSRLTTIARSDISVLSLRRHATSLRQTIRRAYKLWTRYIRHL